MLVADNGCPFRPVQRIESGKPLDFGRFGLQTLAAQVVYRASPAIAVTGDRSTGGRAAHQSSGFDYAWISCGVDAVGTNECIEVENAWRFYCSDQGRMGGGNGGSRQRQVG